MTLMPLVETFWSAAGVSAMADLLAVDDALKPPMMPLAICVTFGAAVGPDAGGEVAPAAGACASTRILLEEMTVRLSCTSMATTAESAEAAASAGSSSAAAKHATAHRAVAVRLACGGGIWRG